MRLLSQSDLIEAFAAWGRHEAGGREKEKASVDLNNKQSCADFALRYRAPLAAAIFSKEPTQTVVVEFEAAESGALLLFDGRSIDAWFDAANAARDKGWEHVQEMASGASPLEGPLVASATYQAAPAPIGPIILWDGWHRAAAWRQRFLNGKPSTISAFLILTAR